MCRTTKISLTCIVIGLCFFVTATGDAISIGAGLINIAFQTSLPVNFFSSLLFRVMIMVIGGILLLIGGRLYKHTEHTAEAFDHDEDVEN